MSTMTEKMAKASAPAKSGAKRQIQNTPKKGERYRCQECGMELQITAECKCKDPEHVHLQCCGQEMHKL